MINPPASNVLLQKFSFSPEIGEMWVQTYALNVNNEADNYVGFVVESPK